MIQNGTYLNVIDNSGAKKVYCIQVKGGYKKRYARIGDIITVSVKMLRTKRRATSKVKKGEVLKALIVRTKCGLKDYSNKSISFFENSVILLNNNNRPIGTRIFGILPKFFRYTKHLKIASLSAGLIS
jgi:large subunit ribosomal protein L14|tara:strand:- start:1424 stop:1807 length:384 start_codon:yes stop_codon:yes gene_type:complete